VSARPRATIYDTSLVVYLLITNNVAAYRVIAASSCMRGDRVGGLHCSDYDPAILLVMLSYFGICAAVTSSNARWSRSTCSHQHGRSSPRCTVPAGMVVCHVCLDYGFALPVQTSYSSISGRHAKGDYVLALDSGYVKSAVNWHQCLTGMERKGGWNIK
jgi:hypothetical protein